MISPDDLAHRIRSMGFACTSCGACCRGSGDDSGLVLATPREVRAVMEATGLAWEEVAMPYPEMIDGPSGARYTLGWCILHEGSACRFIRAGKCSVYFSRPWICRTYPFMLDGDDLLVSDCPGIGGDMTEEEADSLARDLIARKEAEEEEAGGVRDVLRTTPLPHGRTAVIDSEGVKVLRG